MFGLTAPNHCIAMIETNVGFGFVSLNVSVRPLAVMPEMCCVFPSRKSSPPTIDVLQVDVDADRRAHLRAQDPLPRALARRPRVTGEPSLNFRPGRTWNV